MYLTFSIIFFALIKFSGIDMVIHDRPVQARPGVAHAAGTPNEVAVAIAAGAERLHHGWGAKVDHFASLPTEDMWHQLVKTFLSYAPYALFALMPVFALLLKLLYLGTGRRYGMHLLFALHANAFAFAMLALQIALPSSLDALHAALLFWMVAYLPLAMRRVYGGGWIVTLLRWSVLMLLHLLCIVLAIVGTLASAVVA